MSRHSNFWARRRAAVAAEAEAEEQATEAAALDEAQGDRLEGLDDAEILEELGLPDPEEMAPGDDFSAFMSREVPEHLRRLALRKLWRSNPVLACVDGLNDYDDDYRKAAMLQGPVKTAYQVGKGMLAHIVETQRREEAAEDLPAETAEVSEGTQTTVLTEVAAEDPVQHEQNTAPAGEGATETDTNAADTSAPPRRMRFSFAEAGA